MSELQDVPSNQAFGLLSAKLVLPGASSSFLPRGPLLERLDLAWERKLTLLSAPAGFGKTTLMRSWITLRPAAQEQATIAWVALDAGDNDPIRFWRYITTACQRFETSSNRVTPPLGSATLSLLRHAQGLSLLAPQHLSIETALNELINDLTQLNRPCVLVLEDYHVLTEASIHEAVTTFVEHLPAMMHIVLLSRSDLPPPLARLRIQDELLEFHAPDLRFTLDETRIFLQQALPFSLSEETMARLHVRTEGWIVGLKLITLALRERSNEQQRTHFLATFSGRYRHILEYLVNDVLNTQSESLQAFLLQTSGLSRLSGSLCAAVTGRDDSDLLLEQLERSGIFLESLDGSGQWYRYHGLFAEAMQLEVRRRLGEAVQFACASRASCWYEQHDMPTEAVEAALQAHDTERVATLIETFVVTQRLADYQEYHTQQRWLDQLPEETMAKHPLLCLLYANTLVFTMRPRQITNWARVDALLHMAEDGWREQEITIGLGAVLSFRALMSMWQEAFEQAQSYARESLSLLPKEDITWQGISRSIIGRAELQAGQLDMARQTIQESLASMLTVRNHHAARAFILLLAEICIGQGELQQAEAFYRQVLTMCADDLDDQKKALFGLAQLSYERNELATAEHTLQEVLDLSQQFPDESLQVQAELLSVRILSARGAYEQMKKHLQTLLVQTQASPFPIVQQLYRTVLTWQTRLQLARDNLPAVQQWIATSIHATNKQSFKQEEQEALLLVRYHLIQGETSAAMQLLEHRLLTAQKKGYSNSTLEIQTLLALTHADLKQMSEAQKTLHTVLISAQREGYQRLFLDEGPRLQALLCTLLPTIREQPLRDYIQQLLSDFPAATDKQAINTSSMQVAALLDPLSPQEERVLRLLATGRSNPAIANELIVSVNTIRTQMQSIYRKLNVNNRVKAIEVARHHHLL